MNPDLGRQAAEESVEELRKVIDNADMVFITCGLGGGTGTGAAPILAELAKNKGILTVAVVTKPFTFEGSKRKEVAEVGYDNLKDKVDAIISIHNDRILQIIDKKTSLIEAFKTVDEVLRQGIAGISDLITTHGIVNADFADVKSIMQDAGTALMGIGHASGDTRAQDAARMAINSPLLEMTIDGAKGVLFNITGGSSLGMFEIDEAAKVITKSIDNDAKVKFGAVIDEAMGDEVRITVIATGFDESSKRLPASQMFDQPKAVKMPEPRFAQPTPPPVMPEMRKPMFNPKPAPPIEMIPQQQQPPANLIQNNFPSNNNISTNNDEVKEDELDIPAFIRKKMK